MAWPRCADSGVLTRGTGDDPRARSRSFVRTAALDGVRLNETETKEHPMHFVSMSRTLTDFIRDDEARRTIAAPDTRFVFGCTRGYVLDDVDLVPHEIAWAADVLTYGHSHVPVDSLPVDLADLWAEFRAVIVTADAQQRVWWGLGRNNDDEINPFFDVDGDSANYARLTEMLIEQGHQVHNR